MKKPKKVLVKSTNDFPVIGIGASAGGLDAFKQLLMAIPESSGMAYVLVQHLDPNHESLLQELLQKITTIPVVEVTDDIKVAPDHIYIIPSNRMMIANEGVLELSPRPAKNQAKLHMPIDLFFKSLAEVHQSHSIGVVLSGTGTDGTLGLKAIKDYGGITFAQDEATAAYSGMPESAVNARVVDFVLPPSEMPKKLLEVTQIINGNGAENSGQKEEAVLKQILSVLRVRKGTDFTFYKQTTIRRRIFRRMVITKETEPSAYLKYLREDKQEQDVLYMDLLIPVTDFFRDPEAFAKLDTIVFPRIIANKTSDVPIRVWIAGCSTGEEAYSMAIALHELLSHTALKENPSHNIQIFATDISAPAIAKARSGIYSKNDVKGLTPALLQRYFTKKKGVFQVNKIIRESCVFALHDFLKDPPFGRMDIVSCRNVLIYMGGYLQKKALTTFHYALNPKGILWLGKSETTSGVPMHFNSLDKKEKLFSRNEMPGHFIPMTARRSEQSFSDLGGSGKPVNISTDFQKTADDILLKRYTPAGVVINEAMDIVHFRGGTGRYLEPAPGKASLNILKMAKQDLVLELRHILHRAKKENDAVIKENIPIRIPSEDPRSVSIEVIPLPNIVEPHYLVLFHDRGSREGQLSRKGKGDSGGTAAETLTKKDEKDLYIEQLEQELAQTHDDLCSITEEQDAANEELQSANEELLSGSEELQSLNEEMETSKEELQSTNEELMVVHQETLGLNEQLMAARNYAEAIVDTLHEPLVVLDSKLQVKSANSAFYKTFEVNEKDTEGRLIYQLGNKQWNIPALRNLLQDVLPNRSSFENFEVSWNFPNIGERTMLLNGQELKKGNGEEKLILIAIEDVSERTRLHQKEIELRNKFESLLLQAPIAIMVLKGPDYIAELVNDLYLGIVEKGEDFIGRSIFESLPELKSQGIREVMDGVMQSGIPYYGNEVKIVMLRKEQREKGFYNFVYHPTHDHQNRVTGIMVVASEVTEQVLARKQVEESEFRYHNMIHTSPSLISILKGENMIIEIANDAILESWGKGKDIVGKSLFDVLPEAVENGFDKLLRSVYRTGEPVYAYEASITLLRKGKPELVYYTFVYQVQRNVWGVIDGVAIIANEVTPQAVLHKKIQESEFHFRQMADLMPAMISNADKNGKVTYFNKNWLDFTGLGSDELKEFGYQKIMHVEEIEEFGKRLQRAMETGTYLKMEMRFLNKDGVYVWHLNVASPVMDENGAFKMWIGVTTDITEQVRARKGDLESYKKHSVQLEEEVVQRTVQLKRVNNELLDINNELKRMNKELEAFTYVASHDLQEPLRKIQTFVRRISDDEAESLSERGKTYFNRVREESKKMRELIEDLLDFSRLASAERKFVVTDLNKIIAAVIEEFEMTITEKKATIILGKMVEIKAIPFQIRQLMHNLVGNALKFSRNDTPSRITINSKIALGRNLDNGELVPNKKYCRITVEDNGIGFKQAYSDQIFEVFKRLHGKKTFPGTGIGLATVKRIVENHNGTISAKSEPDKGAKFYIDIPFVQDSHEAFKK